MKRKHIYRYVYLLLLWGVLLGVPESAHSQQIDVVGEEADMTRLFGLGPRAKIKLYDNWKKLDIPFDYVNDFIILNITLNGVFPLKFIFDTGAEHTVITKREITDLLGITYIRRFTLLGADMSTELHAYLANGLHFSLETVEAGNQTVLVFEEDYFHFEEYTGVKIQGILGANFFKGYEVMINYQRKVITLYRPGQFNAEKNGFQVLDLEIYRAKPYVVAHLNIQRDTSIPLKFLLDTGASLSMLIYTETDPRLKLPDHFIRSNVGRGLGGFLEGYMGRVHEFTLSDYKLTNVVSSFQDTIVYKDSLLLNQRNGIIGNRILSRFTIVIDYWREKLYIKPNKDYNAEFLYDRSGIAIMVSGPTLNTFTVQDVVPNSPAAEVDIQKGDELKSINHLPISLYELDDLMRMFQKRPGKRIRLVVIRNEKRMKKVFRLRDII